MTLFIYGTPSGRNQLYEMYRDAVEAENNWLEDVIAGLLINGVSMKEIELQFFPSQRRYVVLVRGVPKYEYATKWPI